jgi:catechol 2,3-dioxygenase-like lactoylglutathione lyase family enzyme
MRGVDYRFEAVTLRVADVDRAKTFYEQVGFGLDVDATHGESFRVVQFTPPGSPTSVMFGVGLGTAPDGPVSGLYLVVSDLTAAVADLTERGVTLDPVRHMTPEGWADGVDPDHADYNSFSGFTDPDGNGWLLQERGHRA